MLIRLLLGLLLLPAPVVSAQPLREYRAFWVETFNTPLATSSDVMKVVEAAQTTNANALFVQVRRRGDSWYIDSREPLTEAAGVGEPDASGRWTFDPLRFLVEQAHLRNLQVHAFTIVGTVWNQLAAPRDENHVFLQHIWDRQAGAPYAASDRRQWATRALSHNLAGTTFDGQRFGAEWYVDLGHPDAAAYTIDVLTHLVRRYDVDGIHLDRIRYPEAPIDGGKAINVGYNAASVARFNAVHGRSGDPSPGDAAWQQWRRDQVTAFVRRLYLTVKSIRPQTTVSAALICFGAGPAASGGFSNTEPYWRVFQDWEGWAREGILDLVVPMNYKRESSAAQAVQFDDWLRFTVDTSRASSRLAMIGIGSYLNSSEENMRQWQRVREAGSDGVIFYALASAPSGLMPALAAMARTDPPSRPESAVGHLMGLTSRADSELELRSAQGVLLRRVRTDGNGFYGVAGLTAGSYVIDGCAVEVRAGAVTERLLPCVAQPRRRATRR